MGFTSRNGHVALQNWSPMASHPVLWLLESVPRGGPCGHRGVYKILIANALTEDRPDGRLKTALFFPVSEGIPGQ